MMDIETIREIKSAAKEAIFQDFLRLPFIFRDDFQGPTWLENGNQWTRNQLYLE